VIAQGVGEAVASGDEAVAEVASLTVAQLVENGDIVAVSEVIGSVAGEGSISAAGDAIVDAAEKDVVVTASALAAALSDSENGEATA